MYYISRDSDSIGNHGNPINRPLDNHVALPNNLLESYINAKGFVHIECNEDTVISLQKNDDAYNSYMEAVQSTPDYATEIAELKSQLASTDYKIIKCSEAQLVGDELPYNVAELHTERQALRDRINQLEASIAEEVSTEEVNE